MNGQSRDLPDWRKKSAEKKADGIKWTTWGMVIKVTAQFLVTAILARLLTPAEFGVMALARTFLQFGSYISNAGINRAMVQKSELTETDIGTAFSLSLALGVIGCLTMVILSPAAGIFYNSRQIARVICLTSVSYLFSAMAMVEKGRLQRSMDFYHIVYADVLSYILGYACTAILLAWMGFGVWSISLGTVMQSFVLWLTQKLLCRGRIRLRWDKNAAEQLMKFGGSVTAISMFEYIGGSLDVMISGRLWSADDVGLYTKASQLVTLPVEYISNALTAPMFPALCAAKDDPRKLYDEYLSDFLLVCVVEFSVCVGMAFTADELIAVVLGDQWMCAANLFIIFCFAHAFNYSNTVIGIAMEAAGKLKSKMILQWTQIGILAGGIWLLRSWGMTGVAFSVLIAQIYKFFAIQIIMGRLLRWSRADIRNIIGNLAYIILTQALFQTAAGSAAKLLQLPLIISLALHIFFGASALVFICLIRPTSWIKEYVDIRNIIYTIFRRKGKDT